jgi:glyoxylase-like metal-dependent hydrolase (beta-lactamase superfamily II)
MKLTDGLYAYPWTNPSANNANSYLIRTGQVVLVDPGHASFLQHLFQSMRLDGILEDSIDGVIATHAHPDHLEGLQAFSTRPVWTALGLKDEAFLRRAGEEFYRMMGTSAPELRIDVLLKEGELLIGEEPFQVMETPGHTPGSVCLYWPARKALFTGDVVFEMGVGRTDFPGGDGPALIQSIEKLARLDAEILLPGHGNPIVGRQRIQRNFQVIRETYYDYL